MKIRLFNLRQAARLICCVLILTSCSKNEGVDNRALEKPALISPKNNAENVPVENIDLSWEKVTTPDGREITYNVYLDGNSTPSQMVASGLTTNNFTFKEKLDVDTKYYWKVVARDDKGVIGESNVGMFTTRKANPAELIIGKWMTRLDDADECVKKTYIQYTETEMIDVLYIWENNECKRFSLSVPYELSGNKIIRHFNSYDEEWTIVWFSEDEIEFSWKNGTESVRFTAVRAQED